MKNGSKKKKTTSTDSDFLNAPPRGGGRGVQPLVNRKKQGDGKELLADPTY